MGLPGRQVNCVTGKHTCSIHCCGSPLIDQEGKEREEKGEREEGEIFDTSKIGGLCVCSSLSFCHLLSLRSKTGLGSGRSVSRPRGCSACLPFALTTSVHTSLVLLVHGSDTLLWPLDSTQLPANETGRGRGIPWLPHPSFATSQEMMRIAPHVTLEQRLANRWAQSGLLTVLIFKNCIGM